MACSNPDCHAEQLDHLRLVALLLRVAGGSVRIEQHHIRGLEKYQSVLRYPDSRTGDIIYSLVPLDALAERPATPKDIDGDLLVSRIPGPGWGVRVTHIPTGMVGECSSEPSDHKNKALALKVLREKLAERPATEPEPAYHQDCVCPFPRLLCPKCDHDCGLCKRSRPATEPGEGGHEWLKDGVRVLFKVNALQGRSDTGTVEGSVHTRQWDGCVVVWVRGDDGGKRLLPCSKLVPADSGEGGK